MTGRRALIGAALATTCSLMAGCTSSSTAVSPAAARKLRPAVEQVRQAAASHNFAALQSAVDRLKRLVQREEQSGAVTSDRAAQILDAADILLQDASPSPKPTPTPTPTTASPTPTPTTASPTPTPTPIPTTPSVSPSVSTSPSASPVLTFGATP